MRYRRFALLGAPLVALFALAPGSATASVGPVPQGTQSDAAYALSFTASAVTNVFATTQRTSCYTPEVPVAFSDAGSEGYSGESPCNGASTTGEDLGPYATQAGSNPGYPATQPMLVNGHSESNIVADPNHPSHVIGSSKWFVSPENYNHLLGFYESFDGGAHFTVQGHVPGYEGWTDNTDPVGAFDGYGNYYNFVLAYQFYYNPDGGHNFDMGKPQTPNPNKPQEIVGMAVHPAGSTTAKQWITTHNGGPDYVATYNSIGNEPDKQWMAIDTHPTRADGSVNPNYNNIYAMWAVFNFYGAKPYYSVAKALPDGTHTDWSAPRRLPTLNNSADDTYLLPHVDNNGVLWTTVTNFPGRHAFKYAAIAVDYSTDGGATFQGALPVTTAQNVIYPPYCCYSNTNTRSGILNTFAVGSATGGSPAPLYVSWEDFSTGFANIILSASYDGGHNWSSPIQVNDNATAGVDEFQPNLAVAASGTVSVAFYDRRLACPTQGAEATAAGLPFDTNNPNYIGTLPPYGAANYCANASAQFYDPALKPKGHNIRISQHTFDPELNAALYSRYTNLGKGFLGDYFGNDTAGTVNLSSFVSTYNDGTNPGNRQQQVVSAISIP
jgi:hypothetical protein